MALILKSKKTLDLIENEKSKGGNAQYFRPKPNDKGVFKIFICPPKDEDTAIVQKVLVHEVFNSSGKQAGVVSPANFEEKDPFIKLGWSLKNKYENSKSEKQKNFFKMLVGSNKNFIYIIDPSDIEAGIQLYQAPKPVIDFILNDISNNEGDMDFAHPQTGKFLIVKKTGSKLQTKYACGWSKSACELDGIDEDKLVEMLAELPKSLLGTMFKKPTKDEIEEYKEYVDAQAEKLKITINWKNPKDTELDEELEDDTEDGDDQEDEDLDLEDDTPAPKKAGKTTSKTKPIDDEDDLNLEEDEDLDLED